VLRQEADAACGFTADGDRERGGRALERSGADPRLAVRRRVGVRETVAQVAPDRSIVGVPRQRRDIAAFPIADLTLAENQAHASLEASTGSVAQAPPTSRARRMPVNCQRAVAGKKLR